MAEIAARHDREVFRRQAGQAELDAPAGDRQTPGVAGGVQGHFGALRQLAADVIEHMRRCCRRTGNLQVGSDGLDHFQVHIGGGQVQLAVLGLQPHIRQNRYGVAALDDALNVRQRPQQNRAFDRQLHEIWSVRVGERRGPIHADPKRSL